MKSLFWSRLEGDTVGDLVDKWGSLKPDKEALISKGKRYTWKDIKDLTDSLATAYFEMGLKKGNRIAILGPNHPEMLICSWAAAKVGMIPVPVNVRNKKRDIEYMLTDSGSSAIVTIDEFDNTPFIEIILELKKDISTLENIILHNATEKDWGDIPKLSDLFKIAPDFRKIEKGRPVSSDLFVILYTSGSTGVPKGVVHTHDSMFVDSKAYITERYWVTAKDVHLMGMPWTHMIGHEDFNNTCLLLGQKNVLMEQYNPVDFINLLEKERITWYCGVPTMLTLPMIRVQNLKERDLSNFKLAILCGVYCPPDQMKLIEETYNIDVIQLVGSTEAGCMLCNTRIDEESKRFNTVGRHLSNKEIKICDSEGREVAPGEIGEIWYRGPAVFKYYWNKPELTRQSKDEEGFWHSGDLGKIVDEDGNIAFMGRSKEVIIRGGFNIYPADVEPFIEHLPGVASAVLVGYPDPILIEKTCCYIIPKDGRVESLSGEKIKEVCKKELADYKVPDMIKIVSEVPLLANGKPDKITLKKILLKELGIEG